jgi:hypothetical protein
MTAVEKPSDDFPDSLSRDCLESPDSPKTKALEAYETGKKGLISLPCTNDICAYGSTERVSRQSLEGKFPEVHIQKPA